MAVLLSMRKPKLSVFYVPNLLPVWGKQLAIRSLARRPHESTRSLAVGFPIAETIFFGYRMYSVLKNTCFCPKVMCSSYPRSRPTFDLQPWQRRISSELACWGGVSDLCLSRDGNAVLCLLYLLTDAGTQRSKAF